MNQSFQEFTLIFMQFSIGKKIKNKINSKSGFQNRKPDFRFSINIPISHTVSKCVNVSTTTHLATNHQVVQFRTSCS